MSIVFFLDPAVAEVCAAAEVGLGRGGLDSLEGSEGLLARHTCMEQHTGEAVEDRQSLAEDSFGGDVNECCASVWSAADVRGEIGSGLT